MILTIGHRREPFMLVCMVRVLGIRDGLNPSHARVPADAAPITADNFLEHLISSQRHRHPSDTADARAERFTAGHVRDGKGRVLTPSDLLQPHDEIWFYRMPAYETPVPGHCTPLFSSPGILVVDKPPFLATMPRGRHITETATVRLRRATGNDNLVPAHRLDRPTSGLLLFTTHPRCRGAYQTLFARRQVRKTYQAIAPYHSVLAESHNPSEIEHVTIDSGTISLENDGIHVHQRMEKTHGFIQARLERGEPNAETVISSVRMLTSHDERTLRERYHGWCGEPLRDTPYALYTMHPLSGKTHQLRMCLNSLGVPIVGDQVYPRILPEAINAHHHVDEAWHQPLCLRSTQLSWTDPSLHRPITVTAPDLTHTLGLGG